MISYIWFNYIKNLFESESQHDVSSGERKKCFVEIAGGLKFVAGWLKRGKVDALINCL
jgi:hypothetical protein